MKTDFINSKINIASVTTLLKTAFAGVVIGEVWFFSMELAWNLHQAVTDGNYPLYILWFWFWSGLTVGVLTAIYPFIRGAVADGVKLLRSLRFDVLFMFIGGLIASLSVGGFGTSLYTSIVDKLEPLIVLWPELICPHKNN